MHVTCVRACVWVCGWVYVIEFRMGTSVIARVGGVRVYVRAVCGRVCTCVCVFACVCILVCS